MMVYCPKCGIENEDVAKFCKKCGENLHPLSPSKGVGRREDIVLATAEPRERHEQECFGLPRLGAIIGMAIGLLILLFGIGVILSRYYQTQIEIWPLAVVFFGIMVILAALSRLRGRG